ncbi:MAG: hypothetical protein JWP08_1481 [Bryobacterales bacterium]|nr:hypothetical protein [Bryobacterales bacterium]
MMWLDLVIINWLRNHRIRIIWPPGRILIRSHYARMSIEYTPLITARPHPKFWWMLLFIPLATVVFLALPLAFITALSDWKPSRPLLIGAWAAITAAVMAWCVIRDPESLTWTLTTSDLRRGQRRQQVIFEFNDIESVVIGVPSRLPWYLCWMRVHPAYSRALGVRGASIFVRLRGDRRIPLNFVTGQFLNGQELMEQFVRQHASKIVGPETYTEQELHRMERADLNRVFLL